ncbi:Recombination protein N [Anaerococcus prevotii]|uniref:DNA repair protein RecN n=1 Tax=Anaerococcus prevotii (strain ATCC 9321 / DSM 20548 / JCM 6508 / NCTC 11806 / PC1) TaxID=525919 RepID=C7RHU4_ANAPD|nr:DNA repair protein RecN [Anaerococcus prevotii]ACV29055.1 DNA repair protein RecN [Anaerococcus prevotii DSM 20548]SUU94728.1 Recombination protein N [Anaerococcus prevotii]
MLLELFIDNFVIIKRNHIYFEEGFNVLTGETGSGKSLILQAINLCLGARADKDSIGRFADKTIIEGVFEVNSEIKAILCDMDVSFDDNKLIITRTISKKSSSIRVNGRITNLNSLKDISHILMDIYKQGDSNSFMNSANYIDLIDNFTNDAESKDIRDNLSKLYKQRLELLDKFNKLDLSEEEITRERDLINYQINEIEEVDIFNLDEESLDREYQKLNNISSIMNSSNKIKEYIDSSEFGQVSMTSLINECISEISSYTSVDEKIEDIYKSLINISELINDAYQDIDSYESSLEQDPERMYELDMINQTLFSLKRKYGSTIEDIKGYYDNIKERIKELNEIEGLRTTIDRDRSKINKDLSDYSLQLSEIRKNKSKILEAEINKAIKELDIKNGKFKIDIERKESLGSNGFDDIDFLISTNKGDSLKPLSKTASGGELSRIMLAFKEVFSDADTVDTLIFDEIDTGISGRTAQVVGEKILDLSKKRQIIAISHLPQIASLANNHILIKKEDIEDFTISRTEKLSNGDRSLEIARMISGVDITATSKKSAEEMLQMAEDLRNE